MKINYECMVAGANSVYTQIRSITDYVVNMGFIKREKRSIDPQRLENVIHSLGPNVQLRGAIALTPGGGTTPTPSVLCGDAACDDAACDVSDDIGCNGASSDYGCIR